jgi:hypothetical protein
MTLRALVLPIVLAAIGFAVFGVHKVDEGHIGMYVGLCFILVVVNLLLYLCS